MEKIKNKIIDCLSKENILVQYFNFRGNANMPYGQFAQLAFEIQDDDLPKWEYFIKRVSQYDSEHDIIESSYKNGIFKVTFNEVYEDDRKILFNAFSNFSDALEKKYYKVCPQKDDIKILVTPINNKLKLSIEDLNHFLYLISNYSAKVALAWYIDDYNSSGMEWFERAYGEVFLKYPMVDFKFSIMANIDELSEGWNNLFKKYNIEIDSNYIININVDKKDDLDLLAKGYAEKYLERFKRWIYEKNGKYETWASEILFHVIGIYEHADYNQNGLLLNSTGNIYPYNSYSDEKYKIGNVSDFESINEVFKSGQYVNYSNEITTQFDYKLYELKYNGVYKILRDIDIVADSFLNPYAREVMLQNSFYSVKEINQFMKDINAQFEPLEYNEDNLFECSEYQVFRGINYLKDGLLKFNYNSNFMDSFEKLDIEEKRKLRQAMLFDYLKKVADDALEQNS